MKIKDTSRENLYKLGFHYSILYSTSTESYFVQRFPVYRYNHKPVFECELIVCQEDKKVDCNIYYANTNNIYPPYYDRKFSKNNEVVQEIDKMVKNMTQKMGIK